MANLWVTFGRARATPPLMDGSGRTEPVEIGAEAAATTMVAGTAGARGEDACELLAEADCFVSIGEEPEAEDPNGTGAASPSASFPMKSGERLNRGIKAGDKVSVITAA